MKQTLVVRGTQVISPVKSSVFTPPRKSSEPEVASLKLKTGSFSTPSETRVWNGGDALKTAMDWKAMPIRPSGGNWLISKPIEYCDAAPSVCEFAYYVVCEYFAANGENAAPHTAWSVTITTSVYSSPLTEDPSPKARVKCFPRSREDELADELYALCPSQVDPHVDEGRKRSLLPVSKSTE
jgi:hypothetical protein